MPPQVLRGNPLAAEHSVNEVRVVLSGGFAIRAAARAAVRRENEHREGMGSADGRQYLAQSATAL